MQDVHLLRMFAVKLVEGDLVFVHLDANKIAVVHEVRFLDEDGKLFGTTRAEDLCVVYHCS